VSHHTQISSSIFFFVDIEVKTQGLTLALSLEPFHQAFFVLGIFEIGSCELFAWMGFKP
jgi:hypothetical protein